MTYSEDPNYEIGEIIELLDMFHNGLVVVIMDKNSNGYSGNSDPATWPYVCKVILEDKNRHFKKGRIIGFRFDGIREKKIPFKEGVVRAL